MTAGQSDRETYIGLDVIRFAAALSVVFYHLAYMWWLPTETNAVGNPFRTAFAPIASVARWGNVGVPVFFVLSGFIIATSALGRSAGDFLRSRALRLYPAAWICAPITLISVSATPDVPLRLVRTLSLWPDGPWLSAVYWTLGVEIVFYLIVAGALALGLSLWRVGATLGLISSAFWLLRALDAALGRPAHGLFTAVEQSVWGNLLVEQECFFGVGMALWAIQREGFSWWKGLLLAAFVAAGLVAIYAGARFAILQQGGAAVAAIEPPLIWLFALLLVAASIRTQSLLWRRFRRWAKAIRTVGLATYPIYLVHSELGRTIMLNLPLPPGAALAAAVAFIFLLSLAIVYAERWPRSWLRLILHGGRNDAPIAADLP